MFLTQYLNKDFIGINVRSGNDFKNYQDNKIGFSKTPLEWYKRALPIIRKKYGNLPAFIISDGCEKHLSSLLNLESTYLIKVSTAITDLLILTKAKVLLACGNSTFCAWASFLGGMDTYSAPETPFTKFEINLNRKEQVVGVIDWR